MNTMVMGRVSLTPNRGPPPTKTALFCWYPCVNYWRLIPKFGALGLHVGGYDPICMKWCRTLEPWWTGCLMSGHRAIYPSDNRTFSNIPTPLHPLEMHWVHPPYHQDYYMFRGSWPKPSLSTVWGGLASKQYIYFQWIFALDDPPRFAAPWWLEKITKHILPNGGGNLWWIPWFRIRKKSPTKQKNATKTW